MKTSKMPIRSQVNATANSKLRDVVLVIFIVVTMVGSLAIADEIPPSAQANLLYMQGREHFLDGDLDGAIPLLEKAVAADPENPYVNHQLGELYLRLNQLEKAQVFVEKAIQKDPENVEYHATLGGVYASLKRYDEAKAEYKKILTLDPTNRKAPLLIGILEAEAGEMEAGARTLTEVIKKSPEDVMGYFYRAKVYLELDQLEKAKGDLAKCVELRPSFIEAGTALGLLQERLGDVDGAIQTYSSLRGSGRFRKRLAQLYIQKNLFEKALAELIEFDREESDDYSVKVKIGLILFELKRFQEARDRFSQILKEQPESDNVRFYLGAVLEEIREFDRAAVEFKKVSSDSTAYKDAMLHVGYIYRKQGKIDEALKFTQALLKKDRTKAEFFDMRASFLETKGSLPQAISVLEEGLSLFPDNKQLLYFHGALLDKVGERERSLLSMKKILEKDPEDPSALNFLGYTYAELDRDLDQAEKWVRKAAQLRPGDGFIQDSLGWVLFKRGRLSEALTHLRKASELQPEEPVVQEHLGDVYQHQKKFSEAVTAYEKAVALTEKKDVDFVKKVQGKLAKLRAENRELSVEATASTEIQR